MPLPSPYRNPGRWRAVVFQQEVRHGTAGCLLSVVLLAPLLVPEWGVAPVGALVLVYSCVLVPAVTNYYSFSRLLIRLARALIHGWNKGRSAVHTGLVASLGWVVVWVAHWTQVFLWHVLSMVVRALVVPLVVVGCILQLLHRLYLTFHGPRTTSNQTRHWVQTQQAREAQDLLRLMAWYITVRLGKGVAMSFVLVMFTLQFSHVEPDLVYIASTFIYFVITQRKWTGNERIVSWCRALQVGLLEEEEEFWVPLLLRWLPVAASLCVGALVVPSWPLLVVVAAYTNLLVPGILLADEYLAHQARYSVLTTRCRRATPQEVAEDSMCPVCLDQVRQGRVTPCGHLYHASCLRKCLLLSPLCPLCKQTI
nr:uncharacterized protein LOC128704268 isoform X2 [Cherax quadricarinatus]